MAIARLAIALDAAAIAAGPTLPATTTRRSAVPRHKSNAAWVLLQRRAPRAPARRRRAEAAPPARPVATAGSATPGGENIPPHRQARRRRARVVRIPWH